MEEYPFAREAIREAIYNAIAHNCYMYGTPIQIKIMEDAITISNQCILPDNWTVDTLMKPHDSKPYNPEIANVFYRAGFIENYFKALESALIGQPKVLKSHDGPMGEPKENLLAEKIIRVLRDNPEATYDDLASELGVSRSTIKRAMGNLTIDERIVRVGGKRYGHWEISKNLLSSPF